MTHVSIGVYTLLLPLALVITVATFFIYKAFYDKHTNQVLESGEAKKLKWIAPWGLALIVLGTQLLLVAGVMFPLSMFMYQTDTEEQRITVTNEQPFQIDISDSVKFVIDDTNYEEVTEMSEDGITITVYKNSNENNYFVFLGEIEKESNEPLSVFIDYDTDEEGIVCMASMLGNGNTSKVYFKFECLKEMDKQNSIRVGIVNGKVDEMSGDEIKYDKETTLTF